MTMDIVSLDYINSPGPSFLGWYDSPDSVEEQLAQMPIPLAQGNLPKLDEKKEVLLYEIVRQIINMDLPAGPQGIGDCVSWGWSNLINTVACVQISESLKAQNLLTVAPDDIEGQLRRSAIIEEYQEAATAVLYALMRCEVGGQWGSRSDGAVGAWAAKAATDFGSLSRPALIKAGLSGTYDPKRAKEWGAKGLPDALEPAAKQRILKTTSLIQTFEEAVTSIQNGYPVAVCSNRGFTMTRDSQGFCLPDGTWYHCMLFFANRWDRPGLCCKQSWGKTTPGGPLAKNQPTNTFWVDEKVVNYMLKQRDSFNGSNFQGYPAQDIVTWKH